MSGKSPVDDDPLLDVPAAASPTDVTPPVDTERSTAPSTGRETSEVAPAKGLEPLAEDENENLLVLKKSETNLAVVPSTSAQFPVIVKRSRGKGKGKLVTIKVTPRDSTYMVGILGEEMSPTSVRHPSKRKEAPGILKNIVAPSPAKPAESESLDPKDDKTDGTGSSNVQ